MITEVIRKFGNYTFYDYDRGIEIRMKQLYARHWDASAHVTVWAKDPEGQMHRLYRARTPITTDTAQNRIANRVSDKLLGDEKKNDDGMKGVFGLGSQVLMNDWSATLNRACEDILEAYYAGTPPINLYEQDEVDDDVWRIPGLLSEDVNIVYGQSGSGKSYLAVLWGQAIQHGTDFCGLRTIQGNVLLVDYETTPQKMRRRFKRVDEGLGIDGPPMRYIPASVPVAQMVEPLQEYIMENEIEFVIFDSLARAVGGKITDEEGVGLFFEAIRQLERPCLIIHHTNRGDEYYGSPYIRANARNLWRLRSVHEEGQNKLSIQLEQEKENDGPGVGSLGFVMEFMGDDPIDPTAVSIRPQDASLVPELRKYRNLFQVLEYHIEETMYHRIRIDDIVSTLDLNRSKQSTLRTYIWDLRSGAKKYKRLNEKFHVEGEFLCLNTDRGRERMLEETEEVVREEPDGNNSAGVTL